MTKKISLSEAGEQYRSFIRSIVNSDTGFTLDDLLNNDFSTVLSVINSRTGTEKSQDDEFESLGNFMKKL